MASEWVKLTVRHAIPDGGAPNAYVNLTNASSIFHQAAGGSEIWFLSGSGEEGKIQVTQSPDEIIRLLNESAYAHRT
jgi:hypothetical protein